MIYIVWIVVDRSHRCKFVKTLDQHALVIHIGKSQRAVDPAHPLALSPFCSCIDQCFRNLGIINEINPAESDKFFIPALIRFMVDDPGYAATSSFPLYARKY